MKRLLIFFSFLSVLTFDLRAQYDYHAWPIFASKLNAFTADSMVVMDFTDGPKLIKFPFSNRKHLPTEPVSAAISDSKTGRLLLYADGGDELTDSLGRQTGILFGSTLMPVNDGILFRDHLNSDTIYSLLKFRTSNLAL